MVPIARPETAKPMPDMPLEALDLPARAYNGLKRAGIDTVSQLLALTDAELLAIHGIGISSLGGIRYRLNRYKASHKERLQQLPTGLPVEVVQPVQSPSVRSDATLEAGPPLDLLALSPRPHNCLRRAGIDTIGQLAAMSEEQLLAVRNLGPTSLAEIQQKLAGYLAQHPEYRLPAAPAPQPAAPVSSPSQVPYRPPVVHPALLARAAKIPLNGISVTRLVLPTRDARFLSAQDIRTVGDLARQPADLFAPGFVIPKRVDWYLEWLVTQTKDSWDEEVAGKRVSPVHRLLLSETTLDQLIAEWIEGIGKQAREVLRLRFGYGGPPMTLEEVGQQLEGITRERVRQVQVRALKRLGEPKAGKAIGPLVTVLKQEFADAGGLMTEDEVCDRLSDLVAVEQIEPAWAARLLLHGCKEFNGPQGDLWALAGKPLVLVPSIVNGFVKLLRDAGKQVPAEEILADLRATPFGRDHEAVLDDPFLTAVLRVSQEIESGDGLVWLASRRQASGQETVKAPALPETPRERERPQGPSEQETYEGTALPVALNEWDLGLRQDGQEAVQPSLPPATSREEEQSKSSNGQETYEGAPQPMTFGESGGPARESEQEAAMVLSPPTTLAEWERYLRPQVRRVELLGEIPITAEECTQLGKAIGSRLRRMGPAEAVQVFRRQYPCSLAAFLVAQGVYGYSGMEGYWPGLGQAVGKDLDANWASRLGLLFETVLQELGLPLFPDLGGHRYLALILVHGGIPDYSLADFFANLLQPGVTRPQYAGMSAEELIAEWLWHASGRYFTDKPALRFLEFGGKVAQDFVERCLEMARDYADSGLVPEAGELGLPARVVDAYRRWSAEQDASQIQGKPASRWSLRKPDLVVDPWGEGVLFDLPPQQVPATEIQASIAWQVTVGEKVYEIPVRVRRTGFDWKTSAEGLPISQPAAEYQVTLLAEGQAKRTWRYPGLDDERPLVAFDPERGTILPWQYSLPARRLGLLYLAEYTLRVEGHGELLEELPQLPRGWSTFRGQTWDLTSAHRLELLKGGKPVLSAALRPDESVQRPRLEGGQIASAGDTGGRAPVYVGSPPTVRIPITGRQALEEELARWRLTVCNRWAARPEIDLTSTLAEMRDDLIVAETHVDLLLHLPSMLGPDPVGSFGIRLRGPLGRDADFTLRIVPHLQIRGHDKLYLPDARTGPQPVMLRVETLPGYHVECQGEGEGCHLVAADHHEEIWETELQVDPDVASVELTVTHPLPAGEAVRVPVMVPIRRLRWALVEEQTGASRREWTGQVVKRPVDALLQVQSPCLLVDLPRLETDEVGLRLRLLEAIEGRDEELQTTSWVTAPPGQHLWRFELGAFFDTIRKAGSSPILRFELEAYGLPEAEECLGWPVLSLTRTLLVEDVQLTPQRAGQRPVFELRWREPTRLKNRHVRFWPLWRPWDPVFEQAIPDTAEGVCTFDAPTDKLRSGKYRLEFLVVDPWVPQIPQKPPKGTPGTVDVELISPDRQLRHLDARLQDKGKLFELLLERAVLHHDMGNPTKAQPDYQWCFEHLDDGTVPQILALVELVQAADDAATLRAVQLKMFAASRLEPILQARKRGEISRDHFQAYLGNLPRSGLLPQAACRQLLSVEDETVRLHALQQLIRRGAAEGVETVLSWVEAAMMSDADAIAVLSLNPSFAVERLRERGEGLTAQRLLGGLSQTVEDVARVGQWLRCNLGWGRVERIDHLGTGKQVQWCVAKQSRYRLHVVLRPDVHPETVTIDLASSVAGFAQPGAAHTCAECGQFTTQHIDLLSKHYEVAHRARGYWERRYRRDGYARSHVEDGEIAISGLEFAPGRPAKQLV